MINNLKRIYRRLKGWWFNCPLCQYCIGKCTHSILTCTDPGLIKNAHDFNFTDSDYVLSEKNLRALEDTFKEGFVDEKNGELSDQSLKNLIKMTKEPFLDENGNPIPLTKRP